MPAAPYDKTGCKPYFCKFLQQFVREFSRFRISFLQQFSQFFELLRREGVRQGEMGLETKKAQIWKTHQTQLGGVCLFYR